MKIGKKTWVIPEGYIPQTSTGPEPELTSHDTICILNTNEERAIVKMTLYFTDKDPVGPYTIEVDPERSKHIRFNNLKIPQPIPKGVEYSSLLISNIPIVVQNTRLDSRQSENALFSTLAYGE